MGDTVLALKPPLLNSANPWATTLEDLTALYLCEFTGAVTTRTTLLQGWNHQEAVNQYVFLDVRSNCPMHRESPNANTSLNTLGYSPIALSTYLSYIKQIVNQYKGRRPNHKPFIISVTGTPSEIVTCYSLISSLQRELDHYPLLMEINLSCPNIPSRPPPAFSSEVLREYLVLLQAHLTATADATGTFPSSVPIGIKVPPYTYADQFKGLLDGLVSTTATPRAGCPVSFITAVNTLGSCLVMSDASFAPANAGKEWSASYESAIKSADGSGIGGLGGAAIHPIALGNVHRLRHMLDQHEKLKHIRIIGVGGVSDYSGFERMRAVGADIVAVGTAFGKHGLAVFEKIMLEIEAGKEVFGSISQ